MLSQLEVRELELEAKERLREQAFYLIRDWQTLTWISDYLRLSIERLQYLLRLMILDAPMDRIRPRQCWDYVRLEGLIMDGIEERS